jgi:hypothetical protein
MRLRAFAQTFGKARNKQNQRHSCHLDKADAQAPRLNRWLIVRVVTRATSQPTKAARSLVGRFFRLECFRAIACDVPLLLLSRVQPERLTERLLQNALDASITDRTQRSPAGVGAN